MTKFLLTLATLSLLIVCCKRMQKTPGGLEYKIYTSNTGDKIAAGDLVFFKVIGKVSDSVLFNTYKNTHKPYMDLAVRENFAKGSFEEGLTLLTTGDSALFMISADSFYQVYIGSPAPPFIKKGERISFNIKIDSVITKKDQKERKSIDGVYSTSSSYDKITISISGRSWHSKTIMISGFGSDYDNSKAEYDKGTVEGNKLLRREGAIMVEIGDISNNVLHTSIGGVSMILLKE